MSDQPDEIAYLTRYFETRLDAVEQQSIMRVAGLAREVEIAQQASTTAIDKAERATEKRFESVNEFRLTLTDQTATFVTKDTVDALGQSINEKIDNLARSINEKIDNLRATQAAELKSMAVSNNARMDALSKIVYTLAGGITALQLFLQFVK